MNTRITKQELITQRDTAQNESHRWMIFANAVARGEQVSIVKRGPHTLQVVRHAGPEGGILNYSYKPDGQPVYVSIHNWEAWYDYARRTEPLDKERDQLREAAYQMQEYVLKVQNAHFTAQA